MNNQQVIKDICNKEIQFGCYDSKIDGISIYSIIRRMIRDKIARGTGIPVMEGRSKLNYYSATKNVFLSMYHIGRLLLLGRHYPNVFYAFPRVDKIEGQYLDKFTDPIIELCNIKDSSIIFDNGRAGSHPRPRMHCDNIIYVDSVVLFSRVCSLLTYYYFKKRYNSEIDSFLDSLSRAFGEKFRDDTWIKRFVSSYFQVIFLKIIFKRIKAKRLFGPARDYMVNKFTAANLAGMKTFELQHGIGYEESLMYSGFQDENCMPNFFLAFGENTPSNVYGIEEDRVINIGWALHGYIALLPKQRYNDVDVLVISEPEVTDAIIMAILPLAKANPHVTFYFRPHPHEIITERHRALMSEVSNLCIQDNSINISIVLQSFNHVIGENSTVVYEALTVHKKVGRLYGNGLNPKYLEESDRNAFWEIHSEKDFLTFLNGSVDDKTNKSIYSPFNKELFLKLTGTR